MRNPLPIIPLALLFLSPALAVDGTGPQLESSRKLVMELKQSLGGALKEALASGGPVAALDTCKLKAPQLAADISQKHQAKVGRTTLKQRNPTNAPDAWEKKVLEDFARKVAKGEDPTSLEHSEVVKAKGKKTFRYMKAIAVEPLCLVCHGEALDPTLTQKLSELYPQDQARGYKAGELRGAFTISMPMP